VNKKLLIFNIAQGPNTVDLSPESNSWYLKNYESYFDEVQHLTLMGQNKEAVINGNSGYYFKGSGNTIRDILLSPFRLYKYVKTYKPDFIITYDQLWTWWTIVFIRLFTKTRTYLVPMTFPEQMYKVTGKALSGRLPIWIERILLGLTYRSCFKVITSFNLGNYINWMKQNKIIGKKLIIVNSLPESVIFPKFMKRVLEIMRVDKSNINPAGDKKLIYVGRLHAEKMTDHLVRAMVQIKGKVPGAKLMIVGQGPDKENLKALATELNVADVIEFKEYVANAELPDLLFSADIFVSPSTGHAFREASICGLPIVAYDIDWIQGFLTHKENFYGISNIDYNAFAEGIIALCLDDELKNHIKKHIKNFAFTYWSPENVKESLETIFSKN